MPVDFINSCLRLNGHRLFSAYRILEEAERTRGNKALNPPFRELKTRRKPTSKYTRANIQVYINAATGPEKDVYEELVASWKLKDKGDAKRRAALEDELAEQENTRKAEAEGTMSECGCCFSDYPLNRMVHCDSSQIMHWFCRECARLSAETEIGNSRYELVCMSTDGCSAGFSMEQR